MNGTAGETPTSLGESNPFSPANGVFYLGPVLPAGIPQAEYEQLFVDNEYLEGLGQPFSLRLVYVPEPASLAIIALGGCILTRRRRAS